MCQAASELGALDGTDILLLGGNPGVQQDRRPTHIYDEFFWVPFSPTEVVVTSYNFGLGTLTCLQKRDVVHLHMCWACRQG